MLGELITKHRKANYWTSTKLGCMVGIGSTQMSAIEKGRKRPSVEVYIKLCKLFALNSREQASLDRAYMEIKHGEDFPVIQKMWENIIYSDRGMI